MDPKQAVVLSQLIVLFLLLIPVAIILKKIAKRKGKNEIISVVLAFIPFVNLAYSIYLISFIDKDVVDLIEAIDSFDGEKNA